MFKVSDRVERVGPLVPSYMQYGTVIRVVPNKNDVNWLNEYEVNFGNQLIAIFHESQLRLVKAISEN